MAGCTHGCWTRLSAVPPSGISSSGGTSSAENILSYVLRLLGLGRLRGGSSIPVVSGSRRGVRMERSSGALSLSLPSFLPAGGGAERRRSILCERWSAITHRTVSLVYAFVMPVPPPHSPPPLLVSGPGSGVDRGWRRCGGQMIMRGRTGPKGEEERMGRSDHTHSPPQDIHNNYDAG